MSYGILSIWDIDALLSAILDGPILFRLLCWFLTLVFGEGINEVWPLLTTYLQLLRGDLRVNNGWWCATWLTNTRMLWNMHLGIGWAAYLRYVFHSGYYCPGRDGCSLCWSDIYSLVLCLPLILCAYYEVLWKPSFWHSIWLYFQFIKINMIRSSAKSFLSVMRRYFWKAWSMFSWKR